MIPELDLRALPTEELLRLGNGTRTLDSEIWYEAWRRQSGGEIIFITDKDPQERMAFYKARSKRNLGHLFDYGIDKALDFLAEFLPKWMITILKFIVKEIF